MPTARDVPVEGGAAGRGRYGRLRPRPGLTTASIVAAGTAVIERDGLSTLSMRTLATELGTAPASLYRHVADRDALLLAILEEVAAGMPVDVGEGSPAERLHRRFVSAHHHLARHVWALHILIRGELVARRAFLFVDACLADLTEAGLGPAEAMAAYRACWHLMIGEILDDHPLDPPREPTQRSAVIQDVDPVLLPHLALVSTALPPPAERPDGFPGAVGTLLCGLLARATSPTGTSPAACSTSMPTGPSRPTAAAT